MQTSMRRRIASVALAVLVAFGCGALTALAQETAEGQTAYAAQQGTWKKSSGKWWYAYNGGGYAKSGWAQIGGKWYLFDGAGWMKTGWQQVGGKWYHLSGSGAMQTGWLKDGKTWYYLNQSGAMATGWQKVGGSWYYLAKAGAMRPAGRKLAEAGTISRARVQWPQIPGSAVTTLTRTASGIVPRAARTSLIRKQFIGLTTVRYTTSPKTAYLSSAPPVSTREPLLNRASLASAATAANRQVKFGICRQLIRLSNKIS